LRKGSSPDLNETSMPFTENPGDRIADDCRLHNEYDALLKAFRAGVFWALDELPSEAEDDRRG
jgi:hypothetical protein